MFREHKVFSRDKFKFKLHETQTENITNCKCFEDERCAANNSFMFFSE